KPNWVEAPVEEFSEGQQKIVALDKLLIEGNYSGTFDIRLPYVDTIIYLELPLYVCLYRVIKRWIKNRGKTRVDMGEGCKEKLDYEFITYIWTTYKPRKQKMQARFRALQDNGSSTKVIILKNKKEIHSYLETICQ